MKCAANLFLIRFLRTRNKRKMHFMDLFYEITNKSQKNTQRKASKTYNFCCEPKKWIKDIFSCLLLTWLLISYSRVYKYTTYFPNFPKLYFLLIESVSYCILLYFLCIAIPKERSIKEYAASSWECSFWIILHAAIYQKGCNDSRNKNGLE